MAVDAATYSASVEDNVTIGCLADRQVMGPPERVKTKPVVDLRVARSSPCAASVYSSSSRDSP